MRVKAGQQHWIPVLLAVISLAASNSDTRLVDAARKGDGAAVRALLEQNVDVNAPQGDGATALHWAVHRSDLETTDALIEAGANVNAANPSSRRAMQLRNR